MQCDLRREWVEHKLREEITTRVQEAMYVQVDEDVTLMMQTRLFWRVFVHVRQHVLVHTAMRLLNVL